METATPMIETAPRKEVIDEAVAKVLADPARSFREKMDEVNNLFKRGRITFDAFYQTLSGLAEKNAEVEKIKRDIAVKEKSLASAKSEIRELENQELVIRRMLSQDTLRALREAVIRAVSEAATLEDAEALLTAGIAEVVIQPAAQPEKNAGGQRQEREKLIAQADERTQRLMREIRLERLNQKAVEHIPALGKSAEDADKSEIISILDNYFLTTKEELFTLELTEPEIVFLRKRAIPLLKEWLGAWKDALSPEDKKELEERIQRLPGEMIRRTLMEALK